MYRPLPDGLTIKNSPIEGLGLFTNVDIINIEENTVHKSKRIICSGLKSNWKNVWNIL